MSNRCLFVSRHLFRNGPKLCFCASLGEGFDILLVTHFFTLPFLWFFYKAQTPMYGMTMALCAFSFPFFLFLE